jgi:polyisoprenyl-phosphate glycosyltransferase
MEGAMPELSIVLPAHNEARNVAAMAARLATVARPLGTFELIFVDDGSTDGTLAEPRALAAGDKAQRYLSFTRNFGHQAALRAGLRSARGRDVVLMPETIPALVEEWRRGAKIVVTQRANAGTALTKRLTSRLFYRILDVIGDVRMELGSADFLLLDRAAVDVVNSFQDHEVFLRGLVRSIGFPIAKVSYTQGVRAAGESKFTLRRMIDFAVTGIVAHSVRPLRLAIYLALIFAVIGMLLVIYSIVSFLWIDHTVVGWTSLMSAIAILGTVQLLVLGIVGEYVGRTLRETRGWPICIVAESEAGPEQQSAPVDIRYLRAR